MENGGEMRWCIGQTGVTIMIAFEEFWSTKYTYGRRGVWSLVEAGFHTENCKLFLYTILTTPKVDSSMMKILESDKL